MMRTGVHSPSLTIATHHGDPAAHRPQHLKALRSRRTLTLWVARPMTSALKANCAEDCGSPPPVDVLVIAGVSGCGKRWPWLAALRTAAWQNVQQGRHVVVACSALRQRYRDFIRGGQRQDPQSDMTSVNKAAASEMKAAPRIEFVLLNPPVHLLQARLQARFQLSGHFMPPSLLASQLTTLEAGDDSEWLMIIGDGSCEKTADRHDDTPEEKQWPGVWQGVTVVERNHVTDDGRENGSQNGDIALSDGELNAIVGGFGSSTQTGQFPDTDVIVDRLVRLLNHNKSERQYQNCSMSDTV